MGHATQLTKEGFLVGGTVTSFPSTTTHTQTAAVLYGVKDIRIAQLPVPELREGWVRVAVGATGLCGSDLHYYAAGRNGSNVVRGPLVLGHEASGVVIEATDGALPGLIGQHVSIEPAFACHTCPLCRGGRYNLCTNGTCFGSPPTDGSLRETVVVPVTNVHPVSGLTPEEAALVEPLAVAVWAVRRAGLTLGERVVVTGSGPIGQLVAQVARAAGATWVDVIDPDPDRFSSARAIADAVHERADDLREGASDVLFECSGAPEALSDLGALRPGARIALVGTPAHRTVPEGLLIRAQRYEYELRGCFRYGPGAFAAAAAFAQTRRIDLPRLITARFPLRQAADALHTALTDRTQLKTLITA